jgi:hypothetical protein
MYQLNKNTLLPVLREALVDIAGLRACFEKFYPKIQADNVLTGNTLDLQTLALLNWAESEGRLNDLLQKLVDDPPHGHSGLEYTIFALTQGEIMKTKTSDRPQVQPYQDWFAADIPFVDRSDLRKHLEELAGSPPGPRSVLVIEGQDLSGKTHSTRLAKQCQPADRLVSIDINDYQTRFNALDLARGIMQYRDEEGLPPFDPTKENDAVPRLLSWLIGKLKTRKMWLIIDHCNRQSMTDAARELLLMLTQRVEQGELPNVRLILVDVERNKLPGRLKFATRHDIATPPSVDHIRKWCKSLSDAARRNNSVDQLNRWADEIFIGLDQSFGDPQERYLELENRLRNTAEKILASEVLG